MKILNIEMTGLFVAEKTHGFRNSYLVILFDPLHGIYDR